MLRTIRNGFRDMDKWLLLIAIVLLTFGAINIVTVSSREAAFNMDQSVFYFFYRQIGFIVAGTVLAGFVMLFDTKRYHYLAEFLLLLAVVINFIPIIQGDGFRGTFRWFNVGGFSFQPSELAKPIYIAALAVFLERNCKKFRNPKISHWNLVAILIGLGLVMPGVIFLQRDLGTAGVFLFTFAVMFLLSPILPKKKLKIIGFIISLMMFLLLSFYAVTGRILSETQQERFAFNDPCSRYFDTGYQICNAIISINIGGMTGVGPGRSTQKWSYILEPHTDMVFAIYAEEYGFIISVVIILLYMALLIRILMLASRANTLRGKYICLGVGMMIFLHVFFNLGGLFAMIPLTGITLSFLSYGGSHMVALLVMLAMVQKVHIETKRHKLKF